MQRFLRQVLLNAGLAVLAPTTLALSSTALAEAASPPAWPMHVKGRFVVDRNGKRFKLASVNWYGANDVQFVPGGLNEAPLVDIVQAIHSSGFNSVRLTFANAMLHEERYVEPSAVSANPQLLNKKPLEVFDTVIKALTDSGLAVIINNHSTHAMWCCSYDDDGLWFTNDYSEDRWLADWELLARRYRDNPGVIGADLRNELRTTKWRGTILPQSPNWAHEPNDWRAAAQRAGNRVLAINPDLLIVVEGINFPRYHLRGVVNDPIRLDVPDRVIYSAHNYGYLGPQLIGTRYGDMDYATLTKTIDEEWGFVLRANRSYTAPVWLDEFGDDITGALTGRTWFNNITRYMQENDLDFAYWALNAGAKPSGEVETFSWLGLDWRTPLTDWRSADLNPLLQPHLGPGIEPNWAEDPAHHFEVLTLADADTNLNADRRDWLNGSHKATCREGSRVVGLSGAERQGRPFTHAALCSDYALPLVNAASTTIYSETGDTGAVGSHPSGGDWSSGNNKLECAGDSYLTGIAQTHVSSGYRLTGIRCTQSPQLQAAHCYGLDFARGDAGSSGGAGDWDPEMRKGQCGLKEYAAGVSAKDGVVQAVLCCSL